MKTSARMRSVSQSVQPEDPPSAKKQKTAPAKPKERTKRQPSIVEEEVESDVEEPVVEKPKKKVAAKPVVEKKAKENKPVAPRLTVRKVSTHCLHGNFADIQATPIDDESENGDEYDVPAPKKKARTPARSVSPQPPKISKPLGEANDNIVDDDRKIEEPFKVMKPLIIKKKSKATQVDDDEEEVQPEKKKKRKLLGVQPAFQWDSIMNVSRLSDFGTMLMIVWRWCYSFDSITPEANCC
jgi:hypothetical protein